MTHKKAQPLRILLCITAALLLSFSAHAGSIILTSDQQLEDLMDPDRRIDISTGFNHVEMSLREICEQSRKRGDRTLTIAFDEFFRQYRPQAGTQRLLTPDQDEYVKKIKFISDFAGKYGMGLQLSLLSPLELGPAYRNQTGETGQWVAYKVGRRNASDGSFSLDIWEQIYWTNNKGKVKVSLKEVKAYAFKQRPLGNSLRIAVNPDDIHEIESIRYEAGDTVDLGGLEGGYGLKGSTDTPQSMILPARRLRVYSKGDNAFEDCDRVLVLLRYDTPEIDYFSDKAREFMHGLMDKYKSNGINLNALYSDEMHIQQDWAYFSHHEGGQLNHRFYTKSLAEKYKQRYGQDFDEKYILYFVYGAPDYEGTTRAVRNVQYVMGESPEDIHRTYLLRDRYYKMLNNDVVDLFVDAKRYAEKIYGREFPTSAHASWAESPTIDDWDTEKLEPYGAKYEYTSNFIWANSVHQAAAACYDYFKWGEYLEPTGNDFAECGWYDRDYYGAAMAASIGVINKVPNAYAAAWGLPGEANAWKNDLNEAFGASPGPQMKLLTGNVHRDIEILTVYPLSTIAVEERFGNWMTQYGYANYISAKKLLEMGKVNEDGKLQVAAKTYNTLVIMFEPLPEKGLLDFMKEFAEAGGNVIWFSTPPLMDGSAQNCSAQWQSLFGVGYRFDEYMGEMAPGRMISFQGVLKDVPTQTILTDMMPDRVYPVETEGSDVQTVATMDKKIVGTIRKIGKGQACFFGFRPRDDQSRSLGYETRTLFEILNALGSYPSSGQYASNDNPTVVSRTTDFFAASFPNGATAIVKHYRTHREMGTGGFSRNAEEDRKMLEMNPMPSDALEISNLCVNGHTITYSGKRTMAFNTDKAGRLTAFNGRNCKGVTVDGIEYSLANAPVNLTFGPAADNPDVIRILIEGTADVCIPMPLSARKVTVKADGKTVKGAVLQEGSLKLAADGSFAGKWLNVTVR
jgi:hypothetical protein